MPIWYGTFGYDSPLRNKYVVIEADTREAAYGALDRRFRRVGLRGTTIHTESTFLALNWAGHTHAQRLGLSELTALEEEQIHENRDDQDP